MVYFAFRLRGSLGIREKLGNQKMKFLSRRHRLLSLSMFPNVSAPGGGDLFQTPGPLPHDTKTSWVRVSWRGDGFYCGPKLLAENNHAH